jgi:hypothetical protein
VKGATGALPCRACRVARRVPQLRIEGVLLNGLDLGEAGTAAPPVETDAGPPFELALVA